MDTDIIGQSPISLEIETVGSEARNICFTTEVSLGQMVLRSDERLGFQLNTLAPKNPACSN